MILLLSKTLNRYFFENCVPVWNSGLKHNVKNIIRIFLQETFDSSNIGNVIKNSVMCNLFYIIKNNIKLGVLNENQR